MLIVYNYTLLENISDDATLLENISDDAIETSPDILLPQPQQPSVQHSPEMPKEKQEKKKRTSYYYFL